MVCGEMPSILFLPPACPLLAVTRTNGVIVASQCVKGLIEDLAVLVEVRVRVEVNVFVCCWFTPLQ